MDGKKPSDTVEGIHHNGQASLALIFSVIDLLHEKKLVSKTQVVETARTYAALPYFDCSVLSDALAALEQEAKNG